MKRRQARLGGRDESRRDEEEAREMQSGVECMRSKGDNESRMSRNVVNEFYEKRKNRVKVKVYYPHLPLLPRLSFHPFPLSYLIAGCNDEHAPASAVIEHDDDNDGSSLSVRLPLSLENVMTD